MLPHIVERLNINAELLKASFKKHELVFKTPAGTSRGIMLKKNLWLLYLEYEGFTATGECSIIEGLSADNINAIEPILADLCADIKNYKAWLDEKLITFPSIRMALEMALVELTNHKKHLFFPSDFTKGKGNILINGLIWMGNKESMLAQIKQKVQDGFSCIKLKIGAIDFKDELDLLHFIRKEFSENQLTIRVDANGAFRVDEALEKLNRLSEFNIHSIEQPIAVKQWQEMAALCEKSPIAIALDEELIGIYDKETQEQLLNKIKPAYLILKSSLLGGFEPTQQWISLAKKHDIPWWITSALESNIGLNAIAQFAYTFQNPLPQGLGTGGLYKTNFESPIYLKGENMWCSEIG